MYKKYDRIIHTSQKGWGVGMVTDIIQPFGSKIEIFFEFAGKKTFPISNAKLKLKTVSGTQAQSSFLDNLLILKKNKTIKFFKIPDSIQKFRDKYPDGFDDTKYLNEERNYKWATHEYAKKQLSEKDLIDLINDKNYTEICIRAREVMNYKPKGLHAMNFFHPQGEIFPFDNNVKSKVQNHEPFAKSLFDLLYGKDKFEERFNRYCDILYSLKVGSWPLATFFLFIIFPNEHMMMRPTITIDASELFRFDIRYESQVNYVTYNKVIEFSEYLKNELIRLNPNNIELIPKDMIDVQSFKWCIAQFKL